MLTENVNKHQHHIINIQKMVQEERENHYQKENQTLAKNPMEMKKCISNKILICLLVYLSTKENIFYILRGNKQQEDRGSCIISFTIYILHQILLRQ
jgi:hypothetical protein